MPKLKRALSTHQVAALTSAGTYRVDNSLYLQVRDHGTRSWLFRYARHGKTHWVGLGALRDVPLSRAKQLAVMERAKLINGISPIDERRAAREAARVAAPKQAPTFAWCADQYIEAHRDGWRSAKHLEQWETTLRTYAFPVIGKLPVDQVTVDHVLRILKPIWVAKPETATRLRGRMEKTLSWAAAKQFRNGENPARWQGGALSHLLPAISKVQKIEHHKAVPYSEIPTLMDELRGLDTVGAKALRFTLITASRTGEVIGARWSEVEVDSAIWTIPADRMKNGQSHIIPLSDEAAAILSSMPRTNEFVFAGAKGKPLSNMTMIKCLRSLRDGDPTVHGTARASFSTWAREQTDYPAEVIEAALAHKQSDKVVAAYARTTYFDRRRDLMADWARYCMGTKAD
jgi:integrase